MREAGRTLREGRCDMGRHVREGPLGAGFAPTFPPLEGGARGATTPGRKGRVGGARSGFLPRGTGTRASNLARRGGSGPAGPSHRGVARGGSDRVPPASSPLGAGGAGLLCPAPAARPRAAGEAAAEGAARGGPGAGRCRRRRPRCPPSWSALAIVHLNNFGDSLRVTAEARRLAGTPSPTQQVGHPLTAGVLGISAPLLGSGLNLPGVLWCRASQVQKWPGAQKICILTRGCIALERTGFTWA